MKKISINYRILVALAYDLVAVVIAWYAAFLLRFNFEIPFEYINLIEETLLIVFISKLFAFLSLGLYRGTWRFASLPDLKRIFISVVIASVILVALIFIINSSVRVPRSVLVLDPLLLFFIMGGGRFTYRSLKEYRLYGAYLKKGEPVLILGAGVTAISLVKELSQSSEWLVVGILDDDHAMHGREINGVKILGSILDLTKFAERLNVRHVIIATSFSTQQDRRKALDLISQVGLEALTVPSADDLISGRVNISQIRRIDLEDLLGRDSIDLDNSGLQHLITKHTLLVSGAGGSIGAELCRQILKFKPNHLICLDISEYATYQLEKELSYQQHSTKITYIVGDVKNEARLNNILLIHKPKVVFHAAAYKHVPLMESDNVAEALYNNVLGTFVLAQACKKANVDKFILISTDKAVNPTNVMGVTKRLAEMVCQGLQDKRGTDFVIVRFGNVLGSSGSVIPKFREQISAGGPITVTHPDITRYFMSIPEASQLVMQAGLMGKRGEIFVLDMGEPVRIVDLAKDMIKLSGFTEDEIKIKFTGLRPGEKLFEELLSQNEIILATPHKKLWIASAKSVDKKWVNSLLNWIASVNNKNEILIKDELKIWVEEYQGNINVN